MDQEERGLKQTIDHNWRQLAKQVCACAMSQWALYYRKLRDLDGRTSMLIARSRREFQQELDDIEEFFVSDWYKDTLVGMAPELALCDFQTFKQVTIKEYNNDRKHNSCRNKKK